MGSRATAGGTSLSPAAGGLRAEAPFQLRLAGAGARFGFGRTRRPHRVGHDVELARVPRVAFVQARASAIGRVAGCFRKTPLDARDALVWRNTGLTDRSAPAYRSEHEARPRLPLHGSAHEAVFTGG